MTKEYLKKLLRSDFKFYYTTPSLNEQLYLHYKGFSKIENLEEFTGLKVLYFEGNGLNQISGLENCKEIRSLYLQENLISKIENLDNLTQIVNLNLSDNCIKTVENLGCLKNLQTLQLKRNTIGINGIDDLKGLLEVPQITSLDISDNKISDENALEEVFFKLPCVAVLYLSGNEFVKKVKNYRKTLIHRIPTLKYLDDRPVFDDERRFVEAFFRGGIEEEKLERQKYKQEQEEAHWRNHNAFKQMLQEYKEAHEKQQKEEAKSQPSQAQQQEQPAHNSELQQDGSVTDSNSTSQENPPELENMA